MAQEGTFTFAVVGGGLVGLTTALALAGSISKHNQRIALIAPTAEIPDGRTTALLMPSIEFLEKLGVWEVCKPHSAPLRTMRLVDGTKRLIRAPLTDFKAAELALEAFGYNVPNAIMISELSELIDRHPSITRIDTTAKEVVHGEVGATLHLDNGEQIDAEYLAACDGKNSKLRQAAGIETRLWDYPQTALVLTFTHNLPHNDVSTEFHTETGPFTQVPLPANDTATQRSSLVWVVTPEQAETLLAKGQSELEGIIEQKMHSYLGKITLEGAPQSFPLSGMTAKCFADNSTFLLGESAHVFPPIGAQGFNLGLRDIIALTKTLEEHGIDNKQQILAAYHAQRTADVHLSTGAVDILNRSLLADFLPVQAARAFGLAAVGQLGWLRKMVMKRGLAPTT